MINRLERARLLYAFVAVFCALCLALSVFFFERYLFMRPCGLCVCIRLAFSLVFFGALAAFLAYRWGPARVFGGVLAFAGCVYGVVDSHSLLRQTRSLSCSIAGSPPEFPFGLPLAEWFPSFFNPTGLCGMTEPVPARGVALSEFQEALIGLYQNAEGWYLIPQWRFGSMAECTLTLFVLIGLVLIGIGCERLVAFSKEEQV